MAAASSLVAPIRAAAALLGRGFEIEAVSTASTGYPGNFRTTKAGLWNLRLAY